MDVNQSINPETIQPVNQSSLQPNNRYSFKYIYSTVCTLTTLSSSVNQSTFNNQSIESIHLSFLPSFLPYVLSSSIYSFIHSFMHNHLFIHSFTYLFVRSFINPRRFLEKIVTRSLEGGSIGPPPLLLSTQFIRLT